MVRVLIVHPANITVWEDANRFHADDAGRLHVYEGQKEVAVVAHGQWIYADREENEG